MKKLFIFHQVAKVSFVHFPTLMLIRRCDSSTVQKHFHNENLNFVLVSREAEKLKRRKAIQEGKKESLQFSGWKFQVLSNRKRYGFEFLDFFLSASRKKRWWSTNRTILIKPQSHNNLVRNANSSLKLWIASLSWKFLEGFESKQTKKPKDKHWTQ